MTMSYREGELGDHGLTEGTAMMQFEAVVAECVATVAFELRSITSMLKLTLELPDIVTEALTDSPSVRRSDKSPQSPLTLPVAIAGDVKLGDVARRRRLDPYALPDARAWGVENMRWMERLLARTNVRKAFASQPCEDLPDGNHIRIHVSWVVRKDQAATVSVIPLELTCKAYSSFVPLLFK